MTKTASLCLTATTSEGADQRDSASCYSKAIAGKNDRCKTHRAVLTCLAPSLVTSKHIESVVPRERITAASLQRHGECTGRPTGTRVKIRLTVVTSAVALAALEAAGSRPRASVGKGGSGVTSYVCARVKGVGLWCGVGEREGESSAR